MTPPPRPLPGPGPGPGPGDTTQLTHLLNEKSGWSVFWDKRYRLWRAAEDDPHSALYIESSDMDAVIGYIASHS